MPWTPREKKKKEQNMDENYSLHNQILYLTNTCANWQKGGMQYDGCIEHLKLNHYKQSVCSACCILIVLYFF